MTTTAPFPRATRYPVAVVLRFPYELELIEAIKRTFPPYARSYDPADKTWKITEPHVDRAIFLLQEFFPGAVVETCGARQEAHPPPRPPSYARPDHFATLHLLPSAPPEVVKAAYNALSKLHHPDVLPPERRDHGHRMMLVLNSAIEALRGEGVG